MSGAGLKRVRSSLFFDLWLLAGIELFMMAFLDVRYLFYDTVVTGGDTASWQGIAHHLVTELLPNGRLMGWDMGNFSGYPNFNFYFIPPFLLAALPSYFFDVPLTISLKFAIASGIFLFPVMVYLGLRKMGYRFPVPVIGAAASLLLLFNELQTMFGGNILSTNAGEFCYMFAFALFPWFIGSVYRGAEEEKGAVRNGILLGLIGLSHMFVFVPAVCVVIYLFLAKGRSVYLFRVSLVGFGIMAFWILPMLAYRHPYTTPVYMIWHDFVSWRYAFIGIGFLLLMIGPRIALAAVGTIKNPSADLWWGWAVVGLAGLGAFTLFYLGGTYLVYGKGLFDHGLHITPLSGSPIGPQTAGLLGPWIVPFALAMGLAAVAAGLRSSRSRQGFGTFCRMVGTLFFTGLVLSAALALHHLFGRSIGNRELRDLVLSVPAMVILHALLAGGTMWLLWRRGFRERSILVAGETDSARLGALLGLSFGCVVLYFSAHYLQVPDIRFLPPLALALFLVFFADTLEPFLSRTSGIAKVCSALFVTYGCILVIIFGTSRADNWFRYNNRGYEHNPGFRDFRAANLHLRTSDPLNAPRVGYEKCSLYGIYGGDRVFESLPYFSGRPTMEGIHYASSSSSKFITFFQTIYSKEIKAPRSYLLSRMNASVLPAYLDLYNVSQLILLTNEARESIEGSPHFEKEAAFGKLAIYRYKNSDGRYVDVPRRMPLLYGGDDWMADFYRWFRDGRNLDLLMVPSPYVRDEDDRAILSTQVGDIEELGNLRSDLLDRRGLRVETRLEHQRIEFTTNKVGLPHLIKVSYFPNWKVQGANGVYPVSPHLMLVIPREPTVVLTYGWSPWEIIGSVITGVTLLLLFAHGVRRIRQRTSSEGKSGKGFTGENLLSFFDHRRVRRCAAGLVLLAAVGLIIGGAVNRDKAVRKYVKGYRLYQTALDLKQKGNGEQAEPLFEKAIRVMSPVFDPYPIDDHQDIIHCMILTAGSYENLGDSSAAVALYSRILDDFPFSRYAAESYVKIGRIKRKEGKTEEARECFEKAIREDRWSVWATYARQDLERVGSKE
jgi:hypothetical protein